MLSADGDKIPHDYCWMALALREKKSFDAQEVVIERPDGTRIRLVASSRPIDAQDGKRIGALSMIQELKD